MPGLIQPKRVLQWIDGGCNVQATSLFTGHTAVMFLPITLEQYTRWQSGLDYIQNIMPHLTPDQREFLVSGATPDEWNSTFADDED